MWILPHKRKACRGGKENFWLIGSGKKQGNGGEILADIKTKDAVKGTIKTINKAAIAGQRMKQVYVQTKEKAEHATHAQENSAEEYAADRVEGGIDRVTHEAVYQFDKQGRKGVETTKQNISKAKDGIRQFKEKRAAETLKNQSVRTPRNKGVKAVQETQKTVKC